jgi:hypothetical protein
MPRTACGVPLVAILLATVPVAAVSVTIDIEKTFDFTRARTWGWHPDGRGEIVMARTASDDPAAMREAAEPVLVGAVTAAMEKRGRRMAADAPDLVLTYYLLLTTTASSQTIGQFLPAVAQWAVPPFNAATQSLEIMNEGGLLLYLRSKDVAVWRGFARAKLETNASAGRRDALLREAVSDLLQRLPKAKD